MARITLALIDHDRAFCNEMAEAFKNHYGEAISVIGTAHDGEDGIKLLNEARPDIALIDAHMPVADGVAVVESIKSREETRGISCVMLFGAYMDCGARIASNAGADYICVKPVDIHRLAQCVININNCKKKSFNPYKMTRYEMNRVSVAAGRLKPDDFSFCILRDMGFRLNMKGFFFLRTAICRCIEDPENLDMLTKELYPSIAKIHSTTGQNVERAMRNSILKAWSGSESFRKWSPEHLTVGAFLRLIVENYSHWS